MVMDHLIGPQLGCSTSLDRHLHSEGSYLNMSQNVAVPVLLLNSVHSLLMEVSGKPPTIRVQFSLKTVLISAKIACIQVSAFFCAFPTSVLLKGGAH